MTVETLYKKDYPRTDFAEDLEPLNVKDVRTEDEFLKKMCELLTDTTYTYIPRREEESKKFIRSAIAFSQKHSISTEIIRKSGSITVIFCFDGLRSDKEIGQLFSMADQVFIFNGDNDYNFTATLDYYTHTITRNGRVVAP